MATPNAPMTVNVAVELSSVGVPETCMAFTHVTMQSEKFLCVRETGTTNNVVIMDMANPTAPTRKPITADSTILAPSSKVLALKAQAPGEGGTQGDNLQVFNLDTKQKVRAYVNPVKVQFWTWISDTKIGLITDTACFHWNIESTEPPTKVFDRTSNLQGTQIISYRVSADEKWSTLVGIAPGSPEKPNLIKGFMQLYSVEQNRSQALEAHSACFTTLTLGGKSTNAIVFTTKTFANGVMNSKIHCIALGGSHKKNAELFFPSEFADDFPVSLQISEKFGLAYVVSKMGLLFVYAVDNLAAVYRQRISADPVFLAQAAPTSGGVYVITRRGSVLFVTVSREAMVPFVAQSLKNVQLALAIAQRGDLPGAEPLFVQKFEQECNEGKWKEAAETAAGAPNGVLRTQATITRLQAAPAVPGQKSPLLVFFGSLLTKGQLNAIESVEMSRIAISQNKPDLVSNWMKEGKLTASEPLGDLLKESNRELARGIYETCGAQEKLTMIYAEEGNVEQLVAAAGGRPGEAPNYTYLLQNLLMTNPQGAVALAKAIIKQPGPPMDKTTIANEFIQRQLYAEATSFALDALAEDKPEEGAMQTKIIEINLMFKPEVADAILSGKQFSHYDRPRIAQLCEKSGLYMRALEHYSDLTDIRRVMANTHAIPPEALKEFFGTRLSAEWAAECLGDLVQNPQNVNLVVDIAVEYTDAMGGWQKVLDVLEKAPGAAQVSQLEFAYLARRIATSEEPEEHYRYIVAASKCQQFQVVEQMTRESQHLDVDKVLGFLMDAKLADSRPLINVCDRFDRVTELTAFLYKNNLRTYIEGYVQKVNPSKTPQVVGGLLDVQGDEKFMSDLIMSVRSLLPVKELCAEVEKRNKLKLLDKFLKVLVEEGSQDPDVHNAMGKILIDANSNPEHFLQSNPFYQPAVVGKYCEKRDPHLACVAYKRGHCDDELIDCTNRNSMYKLQARYLVERQDLDVYAKVLDPENEHRREVINQLVNTALPESKHPEMVSCCVKAFMAQDLQSELIKLLEMIVLQDSAFSSNQNLQNLLIITAVKSDPSRVADYIHRLDGFEPKAVAQVALDNNQPEAAFDIFRKGGFKIEALNVLVEKVQDMDRAHEFATKVDDPTVWSTLGHHQLSRRMVNDCIGSYLLAKDSSKYLEVTAMALETKQYDDMVRYLMMVRDKVKDPKVDTEIVIAYAMTDKLGELEAFITSPNQAQIQECGDRCYDEGRFEAARILYLNIKNYGRLASCLVHLKRFNEAVDASRKANSPQTWKEVCFACVDVGEFKLAQLCGLNIITSADDLHEACEYYMARGHFNELIALLESGIGLERAHMGIFTALGEMYANHEPAKLMEHLKLFSTRINIPRLITITDRQMLWKELTFLYEKYDEFDNALEVMMAHDAVAWEHVRFKDVAVKCSTVDIFYKAIQHYFDYHPDLVNDLLKVLEGRIDHSRVVALVRRGGHLGVVKDYLLAVQKNNLVAVNEAINELHISEDDYEGVDASVSGYDNFDQLKLAEELEKHQLIAFRRIAAKVYKKNLKWKKAVNMATKDGLFVDAMETASQSGSPELVKDLLSFFIEAKDQHCFAACLFTCQALVDFHTAVELAWLNQQDLPGVMGLCMPFFVASIREYTNKVDILMSDREKHLEAQEAAAKADPNAGVPALQGPLMITGGSTGYQPGVPPTGYSGGYGQMPPPGYGAPPTGYSQYPTNGMGVPPGQPYM